MVGEPVAYATGFSELKATGPSGTVSNSPITKSQRGFVCGGAPQTHPSGEGRVVQDGECGSSLELQAVAAHRAYVEALAAWEQVFHMASCPICRPEGLTVEEHERRCHNAEIEKERRRVAFRDLCDELGYVPEGRGIALSAPSCPAARRMVRQSDDA